MSIYPRVGAWQLVRVLAGVLALWLAWLPRSDAQSLEPRAYADVPAGVNFLIVGYAYTEGALADSLPVTNSHLDTSSGVAGLFTFAGSVGKVAKFDANIPYTFISGHADYMGQTLSRSINGFGDPAFRLSVNLYGAPALTPAEFASYRQDLVIGASLQIVAPWGHYDSTKVVNIGANIWTFKPEVGASKALGRWTLEVQTAVTLFTDNENFYNGNKRSQDPLYQLQGHVIYSFSHGIWASVDTTYYTGDRSTLNDRLNSDLEQNWARRRHARHAHQPLQLDQAVRQRWGLRAHAEQLQALRHRPAAPLGRRHLVPHGTFHEPAPTRYLSRGAPTSVVEKSR